MGSEEKARQMWLPEARRRKFSKEERMRSALSNTADKSSRVRSENGPWDLTRWK